MLYETGGHSVFLDPLAPAGDDELWTRADERCRGHEVVLPSSPTGRRRTRAAALRWRGR